MGTSQTQQQFFMGRGSGDQSNPTAILPGKREWAPVKYLVSRSVWEPVQPHSQSACVCVYIIQYLSADIIKEGHETLPGCEDGVAGSKAALIIIHCVKLSPLKQTVAKQTKKS